MIKFLHGNIQIEVSPGDRWTSGAQDDSYRDTASATLRDLVAEIEGGRPWREAVAQRFEHGNNWLWQIVTSPLRTLFLRQHPVPAGARVLDLGAGWGQFALPLARDHRALVTALEPTPERLDFIRATARQEGVDARLHYLQADFLDLSFSNSFDWVFCIGVLEWVPKFRSGDPWSTQVEFVRAARNALAVGGRLVIGIENRLGLKYLLGAPDDHLCVPNIAVYHASLARKKCRAVIGREMRSFTYTRAELRELLLQAGFERLEFYAALPDYKLPQKIIPLAPPGNLDAYFLGSAHVPEHDGTNGAPLAYQEELHSHYTSLAALGCSQEFAPSYYVVAA